MPTVEPAQDLAAPGSTFLGDLLFASPHSNGVELRLVRGRLTSNATKEVREKGATA
jgi:hypothetical protein